jgi:tetratricopeptide (TPR) repeat protein
VDLAAELVNSGRCEQAAAIARWALGPGRVQRKFHYFLALDHLERDELQEAYEEAFLEMELCGVYGEGFTAARDLCGALAFHPTDEVLASVRTFITHRDAAAKALVQNEPKRALTEFLAGRDALLDGRRHTRRDFIFLRQLLSDVALEICELQGNGIEAAAEAAHAVLALRPDFVSALMNVAKIALHQGDRRAAYSIWQRAHAIAPFQSTVFDAREEFEHGLS